MTDEARIPLRCSCGRLAAYLVVKDGTPYVELLSRHDGNRHTTLVPWNLSVSEATLDKCAAAV